MAAPPPSRNAAASRPPTAAHRTSAADPAQSSENPAEQALGAPHQPHAGERHRILAVFAHPDDELGCIGSLRKHAERGDEVMLVWTTHGELASQFEGAADAYVRSVRQEHGAHIAELVGAEHHFFDFGDSRMTGSRAEALELAQLYARFRPDAVIAWSDDHPHPDHRMSAKIAFDAITLARIPKILAEGRSAPVPPTANPYAFTSTLRRGRRTRSCTSTSPRRSRSSSRRLRFTRRFTSGPFRWRSLRGASPRAGARSGSLTPKRFSCGSASRPRSSGSCKLHTALSRCVVMIKLMSASVFAPLAAKLLECGALAAGEVPRLWRTSL